MIIKKFTAQTEKEALEQAKKELGKDVTITNIKTVRPKGLARLFKKPVVEVTAAVDDDLQNERRRPSSKANAAYQKSSFDAFVTDKTEPSFDKSNKSSAIEQKLDSLQDMIVKQLGAKDNQEKKEDTEAKNEGVAKPSTCIQMIYNQMINNEVEEIYANKVISEIEQSLKPDATVDTILSTIYQKLVLKLGETKTINTEDIKKKFIVFIGPTGVGKTTTLAKLVSNYMLNKSLKIAIMTLDTYRIGAEQQLATFANILTIPMSVVYTSEELEEKIKDYENYDLVFVDTAGRSHKNRDQMKDLEKLLNVIPEDQRETFLVLSATTKYKDLVKITELYSQITKYSLIFTKLDETGCIGNILNLKMLTDAPLSYATFGQGVPNDISSINPQSIAKQLLGGTK